MDHVTIMSRVSKRIGGILIAVSCMCSPLVSAAASECTAWGEPEFFQTASASRVQACLQDGVDVLLRTDSGETPLHLAAGYSTDPEIIALLVAASADPGHRRVVKFLRDLVARL